MIFLPAFDWLVAGGLVAAIFLVIVVALLVNPPTALVNRMHDRKDEDHK